MITLFIFLHVYFVSFLDKPEKTVPALSPRAIEQRNQWNIPIDNMDYPVSPLYLGKLRKMGIHVYHVSRWMNGATCEMTEKQAEEVATLKFVTGIEMTRDDSNPREFFINKRKPIQQKPSYEIQPIGLVSYEQLAVFNLLPLHEIGYEGQNILMAVCDGGFYHADTLSCFRQKELQLGYYDFTDDKDDFFGSTGTHGTMCLSAISGVTKLYRGASPKAQYILIRSEENETESPKEMDNLVAALEKADSCGVNVFSVSLGYFVFDNFNWDLNPSMLDGCSTRVSQAATIAARKGMLICVAAGNEGNAEWRSIDFPADADSILCVGAIAKDSTIASFSSYGPASDGRIKPDVCAVGVLADLINPYGSIVESNGTSFATPLLAGMAATLWSAFPKENAMQIRERIIQSSHLYNHPDKERYGYGIPDAWAAYSHEPTDIEKTDTYREYYPQKILRKGQIVIIRGGNAYNIAGQVITISH